MSVSKVVSPSPTHTQAGELKKVLLDDQLTALLNAIGKDPKTWAQVCELGF
jgi:hypothetical protein